MPRGCLARDFTLYDDSLAWQRKRFLSTPSVLNAAP